ncbi:MAG: UdgX family uracil-DNA binding protein [Verrucomicrobia bacterium]|nr:UdgX family uracil-DNA binding protein [Verrucomicrobiota bacterium]
MQQLAIEPTFAAWRVAARTALHEHWPPTDLCWEETHSAQGSLFAPSLAGSPAQAGEFRVPRAFVEIARRVACHRAPERWSLLYGILWRLAHGEPHLLQLASDPLVARLTEWDKAVRRDVHKMRAFLRFKAVRRPEGEYWVAWFEPEHLIVEMNAPFFVDRFAQMRWSIFTPDRSAHWNGERLQFTPGASRREAATDDALEDLWRVYYGSIFNPARLKLDAMRAEMPQRYWPNLPEAELIPQLVREAEPRVEAMQQVSAARAPREEFGTPPIPAHPTLPALHEAMQQCRACPIYRDATQAVPGEGPADAKIVLLGEQPGDQEDRQGRPFVGPAGLLLDRALAEAGLERAQCYATNTVKHFKWEPRGKRRLHARASPREIAVCQAWAETELRVIRPRVLVCLGATAAQFVFGRDARIERDRGQLRASAYAPRTLVTTHPSALLRMADEAAKEAAYARFVADLRMAAGALDR